jgi:hypothetical protein
MSTIIVVGPIYGSPTINEAMNYGLGFAVRELPYNETEIAIKGPWRVIALMLRAYRFKRWRPRVEVAE